MLKSRHGNSQNAHAFVDALDDPNMEFMGRSPREVLSNVWEDLKEGVRSLDCKDRRELTLFLMSFACPLRSNAKEFLPSSPLANCLVSAEMVQQVNLF